MDTLVDQELKPMLDDQDWTMTIEPQRSLLDLRLSEVITDVEHCPADMRSLVAPGAGLRGVLRMVSNYDQRLVHQVLWVGFIPLGDQFIAGLADVLAVENGAGENARQVEPVTEGRVRPVLDVERAIQCNRGCPDSQSIHLDGAARAAVFDELVAQFLHRQVDGAFDKACGTREPTDELRLLYSVPLFDPGSVGIDCLDSVCHFGTSLS